MLKRPLPLAPHQIAELAATQLALGAVDRLISRGLLGLSSFTPTDAAHVTGAFTEFDDEAAMLGAKLMARQRNGAGIAIAAKPLDLAEMTLAELHRRSALALMDAALAHEGGRRSGSFQQPAAGHNHFAKHRPATTSLSRLG